MLFKIINQEFVIIWISTWMRKIGYLCKLCIEGATARIVQTRLQTTLTKKKKRQKNRGNGSTSADRQIGGRPDNGNAFPLFFFFRFGRPSAHTFRFILNSYGWVNLMDFVLTWGRFWQIYSFRSFFFLIIFIMIVIELINYNLKMGIGAWSFTWI